MFIENDFEKNYRNNYFKISLVYTELPFIKLKKKKIGFK